MSVTRRDVLLLVPGAALAFASRRGPQLPGGMGSGSGLHAGAASVAEVPRAPVVSFHLDQPYLDLTGLQQPYLPPAGLRSGAPLAALSEAEVFGRFYGFI